MPARRNRFPLTILAVLILLAAVGAGIWWQFFRSPSPGSRQGETTEFLAQFTRYEDQRPLMGTLFSITLYATEEGPAREAIARLIGDRACRARSE